MNGWSAAGSLALALCSFGFFSACAANPEPVLVSCPHVDAYGPHVNAHEVIVSVYESEVGVSRSVYEPGYFAPVQRPVDATEGCVSYLRYELQREWRYPNRRDRELTHEDYLRRFR